MKTKTEIWKAKERCLHWQGRKRNKPTQILPDKASGDAESEALKKWV